MKVTEDMVRRGSNEVDWLEGDVRKALEAALAPYEAPPFVLTQPEKNAVSYWETRVSAASRPGDIRLLLTALDRALKTLGVAQAAPVGDLLTAEEREYIEYRRSSSVGPWLAIIDRLAPKPAPAVKTPGQVLCEALCTSGWEHADRDFFERGAAAVLAAHGAAK